MADNLDEFKEFILATIQREVASMDAQRAVEMPPQTLSQLNPMGAIAESGGLDAGFSTGYDSGTGETIVPFTVGFSLVGSDDRITMSP